MPAETVKEKEEPMRRGGAQEEMRAHTRTHTCTHAHTLLPTHTRRVRVKASHTHTRAHVFLPTETTKEVEEQRQHAEERLEQGRREAEHAKKVYEKGMCTSPCVCVCLCVCGCLALRLWGLGEDADSACVFIPWDWG